MDVLFCDNHVLVVDKPHEMSTQPDLEICAKAWIKEAFKKPGAVFLHPIHRLDKPACGLVIFARTSKALSRLNAAMRERKIRKKYACIVSPSPKKQEAFLEHTLVHGEHKAFVDPSGKKAQLFYKAQNAEGQLAIELFTGRYHQIRAQLSAIGSPILGDTKYGSTQPWKRGIALQHAEVTFPHPITGALITVSSKLDIAYYQEKTK